MDTLDYNKLSKTVLTIAKEAGQEIMQQDTMYMN